MSKEAQPKTEQKVDIKEKEEDTKKKEKAVEDAELVDLTKHWKCTRCNFRNRPYDWICFACFRPRQFKKKSVVKIPSTQKVLLKDENMKQGYKLLTDYPVPEPQEGEVLVKCYAVGVCGSDLSLYNWDECASKIAKRPFIPGHECSGLVVKLGENVPRIFQVGTRVAIENHFFCGECNQCINGRGDICINLGQFGHGKGTQQGGCAQYFTCNAKYCYKLDKRKSKISWRNAALLEPLGVAHNGVTQLATSFAVDLKESCLIIGCGTIGLLAIGILKSRGFKDIYACDIFSHKLQLAKKMGAKEVFNCKSEGNINDWIMKLTDNVGVGRLLECSGNSAMVAKSFELLKKGANIVLIGLPKNDIIIKNAMQNIIFKSINLRSVHGRKIFNTWRDCEELVAKAKINLDLVVSHNMVPLDNYQKAFADLKQGQKDGKCLKIVFDPSL